VTRGIFQGEFDILISHVEMGGRNGLLPETGIFLKRVEIISEVSEPDYFLYDMSV